MCGFLSIVVREKTKKTDELLNPGQLGWGQICQRAAQFSLNFNRTQQ